MRRLEPLQYVLEEYTSTVRKWGQEPSVVGDYRAGLLHSEVLCVVKPPDENFGKYFKIPNRTIWILRSRRPKVVRLREDLTAVMRDTKTIVVPALTDGIYSDYTYGMLVEADPRYDPDHLRLGAAFIELVLRRALLVPLETIKYDVVIAGERKFVAIHETESTGLLEDMDWTRLKELLGEEGRGPHRRARSGHQEDKGAVHGDGEGTAAPEQGAAEGCAANLHLPAR